MPVVELTSPVLVEDKMQQLLRSHPDFSNRVVELAVATITLKREIHADRIMRFNRAAGVTATLPAAVGSGEKYTFIVQTTITTNNAIVKVANTTDVMTGTAWVAQDGGDTVVAFEAGATADTWTGNGTTTGGIKGDRIELVDVAAGLWSVQVSQQATGIEATPFSATV